MTKKLLSLLMASLLLAAALASCANHGQGGGETAGGTLAAEETSPYLDDLPQSLNFDAADIRFIHPGYSEVSGEDIFVEDPGGDIIKQAVYTAQMVVEDRLNVRYKVNLFANGRNPYNEMIVNSYLSNEDAYDISAEMISWAAISAEKGAYADLKATKYLDFTKPYWNPSLVETFSVGENNDRLYWASGDIALSYLKRIVCMLCNKGVAENYGLDVSELEQLVIDGKWTAETMKDYALRVNNIADPTNLNREIDTVGLMVPHNDHATMLATALGVRMMDKEGNLTFGDSHAVDVMQWLVHLFNDNAACTGTWGSVTNETLAVDQGMFLQDRAFLTTVEFQELIDVYSEKVGDFIPLPLPKWSESDDYATFSRTIFVSYSIMRTCPDTDLASAVMECMGSAGYSFLTPAYYEEAMQVKYSDATPESKAIFDIIRKSVVVDWGYNCQTVVTKTSSMVYGYTFIANNDYGWVSAVQARKRAWERCIRDYFDALNGLEEE